MEGLSSDEKVKCIPQPSLVAKPQYTSIGSSYWTNQYSEYFTLHGCTRHSILYRHQYSWRPAAGGGVSKTPGDHHTLLQHNHFRKHFRNHFPSHIFLSFCFFLHQFFLKKYWFNQILWKANDHNWMWNYNPSLPLSTPDGRPGPTSFTEDLSWKCSCLPHRSLLQYDHLELLKSKLF